MAAEADHHRPGPDAARVGILIYDQVEVLDFAGPFEVFSVARRAPDQRRETSSPCPPCLIAPRPGMVSATGGMQILPHACLEDELSLRALVVPGGHGVRQLMEESRLLERLRVLAGEVEVLMSVCTGAALLARAGLLTGREATTHHAYLDWLAELAPDCRVIGDRRVLDGGDLITSGGISAGIDAALHLLERWEGAEVAKTTADYMEYSRQALK